MLMSASCACTTASRARPAGRAISSSAPAPTSSVVVTCDDVAVTLSGHIHRHQVLDSGDRGPVVYAGSVERTSFAEAAETKGFVVLELTREGLGAMAFHPLPARPMQRLAVTFASQDPDAVEAQLSATLATTAPDAVVQLRVEGELPASLSAATLRRLGGDRNVTLIGFAGSQVRRFAGQLPDS